MNKFAGLYKKPINLFKFSFVKSLGILLCCFLYSIGPVKAQLSAADSTFFNSIFTQPRFISPLQYPGNWFIYDTIRSTAALYASFDSNFKFTLKDLDSLHKMSVASTLISDTQRNNSFNQFPSLYPMIDPIKVLPFSLNQKQQKAYTVFNKGIEQTNCKAAYIIMQGSGINNTKDLVNDTGYHNINCKLLSHLKSKGDVFTLIKPNEDIRAMYWNGMKLNDYIFSYLETSKHHYGINYLIELIALIKYVKQYYDKVYLLGLSEGGYASLLANLFEETDEVVISGGYSINFDTFAWSNSTLRTRFDSLVDRYVKFNLKTKIQQSNTSYLFTWGNNETVPLMQEEHNFKYTSNYFNGVNNTKFYYNFNYHSFPSCEVIDSFIQLENRPKTHFQIVDSSKADSVITKVNFCGNGPIDFKLFRDGILYATYFNITDSILIRLKYGGKYYLKDIQNGKDLFLSCKDTIKINLPKVLNVSCNKFDQNIHVNSPFQSQLIIHVLYTKFNEPHTIKIHDLQGRELFCKMGKQGEDISLNTSNWGNGIYIISLQTQNGNCSRKIFKTN